MYFINNNEWGKEEFYLLEMKNQRMFQRVLVELKSMVDVVLLYINAVGYVVRIHSSKHVSI